MIVSHLVQPDQCAGRIRRNPLTRSLVRETVLRSHQLILPIFLSEDEGDAGPIGDMPGIRRYALREVDELASRVRDSGIGGVLLFGVPGVKDGCGSRGAAPDGVVARATGVFKRHGVMVATDVCLCQYTDHGHCGVLADGQIDPEASKRAYAEIAIAHAAAGADVVAPSGMIDGTTGALRMALDSTSHDDVAIMSYSMKFASAFYGPFRTAAASSPSFGDRRTHQIDPSNGRDARRAARADEEQGADMLMVKPATPYLDVISDARRGSDLPIAAYHVSGEYSMIELAASAGVLDRRAGVLESLIASRRAGADIIITYHALDVARWLEDER